MFSNFIDAITIGILKSLHDQCTGGQKSVRTIVDTNLVGNYHQHRRAAAVKMAKALQINKKRKFVADGVFYSELNEVPYASIFLEDEQNCKSFSIQLFQRQLAEDGYAGLEVRATPVRTEIIIKATRTQDVLGEKGQRIRELTSVVQKRFCYSFIQLYCTLCIRMLSII